MDDKDCKKMGMLAELKIRQYFDYFLEKTLPTILENHVTGCPHGKRVSRVKWALIGAAAVLVILIPAVGKSLAAVLFKI